MSAQSSTPDTRRALNAYGIPSLRHYALLTSLIVCVALLAGCGSETTKSTQPQTLTVSAAADLTPAFQEIGREFERQDGTKVIFNARR